jgi:hypothetical protein
MFLGRFASIRRAGCFRLEEVCDCSHGVAGLSARVGLSAGWPRTVRFRGALLEVQCSFSDGPPPTRGQSAPSSRTVRLVLSRLPKSFASWVALLYCFELGFVPSIGRSVVTTWPWQTRVGTLGCEFGAYAEFIIREESAPIHTPLWSPNRSFSHSSWRQGQLFLKKS